MNNLLRMRDVHPSIRNPQLAQNRHVFEENAKRAELQSLCNPIVVRKLLPILDTEGIMSLSYLQSATNNVVLSNMDQNQFHMRISYLMYKTELYGRSSKWLLRLHMNSSVKLYGYTDGVLIPTEAVLKVPNIIVDSHYASSIDFMSFLYTPAQLLLPIFWVPIQSCVNVKSMSFIFVNINEVDLEPYVSKMNWPNLKKIHLESVQTNVPIVSNSSPDPTVVVNPEFVDGLFVPRHLVKILVSQPEIEDIKFVSLYLNDNAISELEEALADKYLGKVQNLHLEDILIKPENIPRMDNIVLKLIRSKSFKNLVLSLHPSQFGASLIDHMLENNIQVESIELIINVVDACLEYFNVITRLQSLCQEMKLTFYRTTQTIHVRRIHFAMKNEMEKWCKVTEVTLGKSVYPYIQIEVQNSDTYIDYIYYMHLIPNIKQFGFKDRVKADVLNALATLFDRTRLEKITLALSEPLAPNGYNMQVYNKLLSEIPIGTSSISLLYYPMDEESLVLLSRHAHTLKHLTYFQLHRRKMTRKEVERAFPNTALSMKSWLSTTPGLARNNAISNFMMNR
ncbi:unnamed protein product [Caenorhabditis brenneri]